MLSNIIVPGQDFVEKEFGFIWINDGILFIQYKPVVVDAEIVNEAIDSKTDICSGKEYPSLIDIRNIKYWTLEGRKVSFGREDSFTGLKASALINSCPVGNIVVNWALRFMIPKIPVKHFTGLKKV